MPFAVFWMRAHFVNMPSELSEAARVDGAGTWDLFWRIHVPLATPAIVSLGILMSVWTWNQFLLALVLVDDPKQRTVAGALGRLPGPMGDGHPAALCGIDPDPSAHAHLLRDLPAAGHRPPCSRARSRADPRLIAKELPRDRRVQPRRVAVHGDVEDGFGPVMDEFVRELP